MSIKAIIFDCDGTLVSSEEYHYLAWKEVLQKRGYFLEKAFYAAHCCGVSDVLILKMASALLGKDHGWGLLEEKNALFEVYQKRGVFPIIPTTDFLGRLFAQREKWALKLAVASGAGKGEILRNLRGIQKEHCFEVVLSGSDDLEEYQDPEGTNKPKPYVYLKTAKLLGCRPEECIAVEDSRSGVLAAVAAGCITVAIPNLYTQGHDFSPAHVKLDSLAGLEVEDFLRLV